MNDIDRIRQLFKAATGRSICHVLGCADCHDIYTDGCPLECDVSSEELIEFVNKINSLLKEYANTHDNDSYFSEEDLLSILLSAE